MANKDWGAACSSHTLCSCTWKGYRRIHGVYEAPYAMPCSLCQYLSAFGDRGLGSAERCTNGCVPARRRCLPRQDIWGKDLHRFLRSPLKANPAFTMWVAAKSCTRNASRAASRAFIAGNWLPGQQRCKESGQYQSPYALHVFFLACSYCYNLAISETDSETTASVPFGALLNTIKGID